MGRTSHSGLAAAFVKNRKFNLMPIGLQLSYVGYKLLQCEAQSAKGNGRNKLKKAN